MTPKLGMLVMVEALLNGVPTKVIGQIHQIDKIRRGRVLLTLASGGDIVKVAVDRSKVVRLLRGRDVS